MKPVQRFDDSCAPTIDSTLPIAQLWMLRLLIPTKQLDQILFSRERHRSTTLLAIQHTFNLHEDDSDDDLLHPEDFSSESKNKPDSRRHLHQELIAIYQKMEARCSEISSPPIMSTNLDRLSAILELNLTERMLLEFSVLLKTESALDAVAADISITSLMQLYRVLAIMIDQPESVVRDALSAKGMLNRSGILSINLSNNQQLSNRIDLNIHGFADLIQAQETDPIELLRNIVAPAPAPKLVLSDFAHLKQALPLLLPHLATSLKTGRKGVNIYIHGAPGTGKTELSRILGSVLDCPIFEVSNQDEDGDPVPGIARLRALRAAQSILRNRRALLVFDEAEDVFGQHDLLLSLFAKARGATQSNKGWMTRTLEENSIPTIWLSNQIGGMDPAFVRRFDMVFELDTPPKAQRQTHLQQVTLGLVDERTLADLAEFPTITPAVVARAAEVVAGVQSHAQHPTLFSNGDSGPLVTTGKDHSVNRDEYTADPMPAADALKYLISNTLQAQGHRPLPLRSSKVLPEIYDPKLITADTDVEALAQGLKSHSEARICFYGLPGTGKTALAHWLAEQIDKPLIIKRASDLLGMYVGQTEQNMAQAFRLAATDDAILLIDEVDSFLQNRSAARHSWEVTQVNEMLTQMEQFQGIFIASTNLMDGLDPAALRRFDLKVSFSPLSKLGAWTLFTRHCTHLDLGEPSINHRLNLEQFSQLTPGDFATVMRQHRFAPLLDVDALLTALKQEHDLKQPVSNRIGFV